MAFKIHGYPKNCKKYLAIPQDYFGEGMQEICWDDGMLSGSEEFVKIVDGRISKGVFDPSITWGFPHGLGLSNNCGDGWKKYGTIAYHTLIALFDENATVTGDIPQLEPLSENEVC